MNIKTTLFWSLISIAAVSCYTPKESETNVRATKRFRSPMPSAGSVDTVVVSGVQNISITGRSENGVQKDLAGTWVLHTLKGIVLADAGHEKLDELNKKKITGTQRDTASSIKIENGKMVEVTEVTTTNPAEAGSKITPPQSAAYHIPARPYISFYGSNETFSGFTGCNKFAGRYTISGQRSINFRKAAPSTRMACIGDYDEATFIEALQNINTFNNKDGQLELLQGNNVIMVFIRRS